eukprot:CAMPEP_0171056398 /NCGR_PEP_ID=MMETSP0766_2-20121228/906_1 /TAXON_ID=439317 /ORGANISM="Gambierdiscus australes, Strain CAWD 149" /LENGTH=52 /DNA_ID=CAMNT_0011511289 /DNA_START=68 /DNA_END=222 /DNA_ORIENTATION=+
MAPARRGLLLAVALLTAGAWVACPGFLQAVPRGSPAPQVAPAGVAAGGLMPR